MVGGRATAVAVGALGWLGFLVCMHLWATGRLPEWFAALLAAAIGSVGMLLARTIWRRASARRP